MEYESKVKKKEHMKRSILDITSDLALVQHDVQLISEEDVMQRVDELYVELHRKEDGIYWFYRNVEGQISIFKEQIDKLAKYVKTLKNAQETEEISEENIPIPKELNEQLLSSMTLDNLCLILLSMCTPRY